METGEFKKVVISVDSELNKNMDYKFIPAAYSGLSLKRAEAVGKELVNIEKKNGRITPYLVLERAKNEDSSLHSLFTWDDTEAAEKHRLYEASTIIRSVRIIPMEGNKHTPIRAFVSVQSNEEDDFNGRGYISSVRAFSNEDYREQVLRDAHNEIVAWKKRYQEYHEFAEICQAISSFKPKRRLTAKAA